MTPFLRNSGFGLLLLGGLLILIWAIEPFRVIWPWLMTLPLIIRIGVIAATLGLAILMGGLIAERFRERESDKSLLDEL